MTEWVALQLELLAAQWPDLEYNQAGHWAQIPGWELPAGWTPQVVDIAFQIKEEADQPPYAFYANATDIKHNANVPGNWSPTTDQVCFPGTWSQFSWSPETWVPTANPALGPNMVIFVRSFALRFAEGA
ncbi:MAG: hypothetical protein OSB43_04145 [Nocardioides sp.]|uniref:hypothetical protein n=1 Tax=Nocardioides sp. TaxID=35761 RepID=UPI002383B6C1|nr:hypothetical protein [Nocardioides sp.]MDE0775448.1 hypothetical protein [Nocardioides sp.]